jgi:hypothetical protein
MKGKFVLKKMPLTTTNLNKAIVNFLLAAGHSASRVNTAGIYDPEQEAWRRTGGRKGFFDIVASLKPDGKYLTIDTKVGRDTPSDEQKEYAAEVKSTGGIVWYVDTYEDFLNKYYSLFNQSK